jgi:hypothetical protein
MSDLEIKNELEIINEEETPEVKSIKPMPEKSSDLTIKILGIICVISLLLSAYSIHTINNMNKQLISANEHIDILKVGFDLNKMMIQSLSKNESPAFLDISSPDSGYDFASNKCGAFLVSLKDVSPHLNGSFKATIRIGNISYATFNGFKIKYQWGFLENTEQIKELSFTENLNPGSWNTITAYLSAPPEEGENVLRIYIETDSISLY